jgi:hypothetical protein
MVRGSEWSGGRVLKFDINVGNISNYTEATLAGLTDKKQGTVYVPEYVIIKININVGRRQARQRSHRAFLTSQPGIGGQLEFPFVILIRCRMGWERKQQQEKQAAEYRVHEFVL